MCFTTAAPNSLHFTSLAAGIIRAKSYVTVFAAIAPSMPRITMFVDGSTPASSSTRLPMDLAEAVTTPMGRFLPRKDATSGSWSMLDSATGMFTRFAEGLEDKLRAGKVSTQTIAETMNLMHRAVGVLNGAFDFRDYLYRDLAVGA